jgi:GWxTD domain-containing protein
MFSSLLCALGALTAAASAPPIPPVLAVKAVRFFAPADTQTRVLAVAQIPYALAEPAGDRIAWTTTVEVKDKHGQTLLTESWQAGAPAALRIPDAVQVEALRFPPMVPGSYTIVLTITDSVTKRAVSAETVVDAFARSPGVSDLLLASAMRVAAEGDTLLARGEVARGALRIVTAPTLVLDPLQPTIAFLLEAYAAAEATAVTTITIREATGGAVVSLPAFRRTMPAGGGVIRGEFPLDGLPEGAYTFVAAVAMGGETLERTGSFTVGNLQAALQRQLVARAANRDLDEAFFGAMAEAELDQAAEQLQLLATPRQLEVYQATGERKLSVEAKRRFLVTFWSQRDDTKATPANERRLAFYDGVALADSLYGEAGRRGRPGWKTDRGRVYVTYGKPDEIFRRQQEGRAPPYEIWRYTQGRLRYYIFADRTNYGLYTLMKSNDLAEAGQANWLDVMTPEAVRDIGQYLGLNFFETGPGSTLRP